MKPAITLGEITKRVSTRSLRKQCKHPSWLLARGRRYEVCVVCGDRFPCKSCDHFDCIDARDAGCIDKWPAWVKGA